MKAFDKVPHKRLLYKLQMYGIKGDALGWITSFLSNRTQQVLVNDAKSGTAPVTSGIPQGSVLGPILFVLYINDLPEVVDKDSFVFLFADDTKVFRQIKSDEDRSVLQKDIQNLLNWSDKWLLKFHPDKCLCMGIGYSEETENTFYNMNGQLLSMTNCEKDLGVFFDRQLKFEHHINNLVNKANRILGIVKKTFDCMDKSTFCYIFKGLVRPHLEYAAPVWSPHLIKHIDALENVQIRATKLVPGLSNLDYPVRLKRLKLPTLAYRRTRGDMINAYKIINGGFDSTITSMLPLNTTYQRGHDHRIYVDRSNKDVRKFNFTMRVRKLWNDLPDKVVSASDVKEFEIELDNYWKKQDLLYNNYKAEIVLRKPERYLHQY